MNLNVFKGMILLLCVILCGFLTVHGQEALTILPTGDSHTRALGETIMFTCKTDSNNPQLKPNLKWIDAKGQEIVDSEDRNAGQTSARIHVEKDGNTILKLYLTRIENGDAGTYTCEGDISGRKERKTVILEHYKDITFEDAPALQHPEIYKDALIVCRVTGNPTPSVSWRFNGDRVTTGGRYVVSPDGLRIINVTRAQDDGLYECRAEVAEDGRYNKKDIRVEVHIPPVITKELGDNTGIEGQEVAIGCKANGLPDPKYEFRKNGESQLVDTDNRKQVDRDSGTIHFRTLHRDDAGTYTCTAINDVGNDVSTGKLDVIVPPKIMEYTNVTQKEGLTQSLTCKSEGEPPATMAFRKQGTMTDWTPGEYESGRIKVTSKANELVLTIDKLKPSDTANYTCRANNTGGFAERNGTIIVQFAPLFPVEQPTVFYGWASKTRNITCQTEAEPAPSFKWIHFNHELLNNETFKILNLIKNSNLQVTVKDEDQSWIYGRYTCEANNQHGKKSNVYEFKRANVPGKPKDAVVVEDSPTTVKLRVQAPDDDGGVPVIYYRVEFNQFLMEKGVEGNESSNVSSITKDISSSEELLIENLNPSTNYMFNVRARNEVGPGAPIQVTHLTDSISKPYPIEVTSEPQGRQPYEYNILWDVPKTGGSPINEYRIKYRKVEVNESDQIVKTLEDWIEKLQTDTNANPSRSHVLRGLSPNTHYELQVLARNDIGWSEPNTLFVFNTAQEPDSAKSGVAHPDVPTSVVIGVVIAVFIIFLIVVDVACYFVNNCGVTKCLCVNVCGEPEQTLMDAEKGGDGEETKTVPVEEQKVVSETESAPGPTGSQADAPASPQKEEVEQEDDKVYPDDVVDDSTYLNSQMTADEPIESLATDEPTSDQRALTADELSEDAMAPQTGSAPNEANTEDDADDADENTPLAGNDAKC